MIFIKMFTNVKKEQIRKYMLKTKSSFFQMKEVDSFKIWKKMMAKVSTLLLKSEILDVIVVIFYNMIYGQKDLIS